MTGDNDLDEEARDNIAYDEDDEMSDQLEKASCICGSVFKSQIP